MRSIRAAATGAVTLSLALAASACGGGSSTDGGSNDSPKTLTYWASNQGASIAVDKKVLQPELDKFEKQTGIKVKLEVVPWSDLLNRILTATTSGQGPDVLNIGNTWSASLQATGALLPWDAKNFAAIGGKDRFVDSALGSTGAQGKDPAAVPLYSMAYALYYNKKMFADAGIAKPPATWDGTGRRRQEAVQGRQVGPGHGGFEPCRRTSTTPSSSPSSTAPTSSPPTASPTSRTTGAVAGVKQYVDLMAKDKVIAPGNAEYAQNQSVSDFAKGKNGDAAVAVRVRQPHVPGHERGRLRHRPRARAVRHPGHRHATSTRWSRASTSPSSRTPTTSTAPPKFVKFMTSDAEQKILNTAYSSIPPVQDRTVGRRLQHPRERGPEGDPGEQRRGPSAGRRRVAVRDGGRYGHQGTVRRRGRRTRGHHRVGARRSSKRPSSRCRRSER